MFAKKSIELQFHSETDKLTDSRFKVSKQSIVVLFKVQFRNSPKLNIYGII